METALEVKNLVKRYKEVDAVKGISFSVDKGEVFALIGPNGAGKTSTLRMISTLLSPTDGDAEVDGISIRENPAKVRERITYLPDEAGVYKNMTGKEYLYFMASLFFTDRSKSNECAERAVQITNLGDRILDKVSSYSRGMIRKLLLARAVMTKPSVAILDEPTSGLDVINALEIRRMIKELSHEGMSFLVSSHNMLEIEFMCDRIAIINEGVIHAMGKPDDLKEQYGCANLEEVFERVVDHNEVSNPA